MSILKVALKKIKKISENDFKKCYDIIRKTYIAEEEAEDDELKLADYNIDDLEYALRNIEVFKVKSLTIIQDGKENKIFPHPSYGWDGGSAINTIEFNLKSLVYNDFGGGPGASIVCLKNQMYPGLAFHHAEDLSEIHIFNI